MTKPSKSKPATRTALVDFDAGVDEVRDSRVQEGRVVAMAVVVVELSSFSRKS